MASQHPTLEARGIGRRVAGRGDWLLQDIHLEIGPGSRLAIVGPSGSGKTLLLRALAMLDVLDAGELRWSGERLRDRDVPGFRSRVMYLQQRPALREGTVEENLRHPFSLRIHRNRAFDAGRIEKLLGWLGRDRRFLEKEEQDLSGGERQITALLRALQLDPYILLLDEPTTALDSAATDAVERLIAQWLDESPRRRSTLWVSHDRRQTDRVSERILHIDQGRLESDEGSDVR